MRENQNKKEKSKKEKVITACIIVGMLVFVVLVAFSSDEVTIREDGISIYLHQDGIDNLWAGGYEVRFDDIADIELLPYSARQLGDRIEGLSVPSPGRYRNRASGPYTTVTVARYDSENNHRLHVSRLPEDAPTIWITRYENVPVLLSFQNGSETEALYEQLVTAWEQWRIS